MKVKFKTAHGYLSFQPDGRVEYRDTAGPWEEVDLEGFELQPVPVVAPGTPPGTSPPAAGPGPAEPTVAYVGAVKAWLTARGVDLSGPCGAFAIVKVVAWGLRTSGYGLLSKPGGNNCKPPGSQEAFATDVVVCPNRTDIVDLLQDGGGANNPIWLLRQNEVDPARWRAPVEPT